jgi:hypothetical protein
MRLPKSQLTLRQLMLAVADFTSALLVSVRYYESTLPISKLEAIRLAKEFVMCNGCTDLAAEPGSYRMTAESVVLTSSIEEEMNCRHEMLE